jgi:hypothetical protein
MARNRPDVIYIALVLADDSVGIMSFVTTEYAEGAPKWSRAPSPVEIEKEIAKASKSFEPHTVPVKSWRLIAAQEIPIDRTYRNALRDNGKKLYHDMPRAREIYRDQIRETRAPKLAELDIAYQRADEKGDRGGQREIAAEKQRLRDLPARPEIEGATTIEMLRNLRVE